MQVEIITVAAKTSTGTQDITVPGFGTPKLALFFYTQASSDNVQTTTKTVGIGATDGTAQGCCTFTVVNGVTSTQSERESSSTQVIAYDTDTPGLGEASFSAWITDGVRLDWTTGATNPYRINVVLLSGDEITDCDTAWYDCALTAELGFRPSALLALCHGAGPADKNFNHAIYSIGALSDDGSTTVQKCLGSSAPPDGQTTTTYAQELFSNRLAAQVHAEAVSWSSAASALTSTGFTFSPTGSTSGDDAFLVSLASTAGTKVGVINTPTTTGNFSVTGLGFKPKVIFFIGSLLEAEDTLDTTTRAEAIAFGVATEAAERSICGSGSDGVTTTNEISLSSTSALEVITGTGSVSLKASLVSADADGFTLDFVNVAANAKKLVYLALGESDPKVTPTSIESAESFGTTSISVAGVVGASAIGSLEAFGSLTVANADPNDVVWAITYPPSRTGCRMSFKLTSPSSAITVQVQDYSTGTPVFTTDPITLDAHNVGKAVITGLTENTQYKYVIRDAGVEDTTWVGEFYTAPDPDANVSYRIAMCSDNGNSTTPENPLGPVRMVDLVNAAPRFFMAQGDSPHADVNANDQDTYRTRWDLLYARSQMQTALRTVPMAYLIGDHDFSGDNSKASSPGAPACRAVFNQYQPMELFNAGTGVDGSLAHYFVYGKIRHVCIDERSFRDSIGTNNPLLGATQLQWLKDQLLAAKNAGQCVFLHMHAPWCSVSTTEDNWGEYPTERTEIMDYAESIGMQNSVAVFHGDAHMLAYDDGTNTKYGTSGLYGWPTVCTSSMDRGSSIKGGPWSHGTNGGTDQFGYVDISTTATTLTGDVTFVKTDNTVWQTVQFNLEIPTNEIIPNSIGSAESFGAAQVVNAGVLSPVSVASLETFGTPEVSTEVGAFQLVQAGYGGNGDVDDTTVSATFTQQATAGNLLVIFLSVDKVPGTITTPTGYTLIQEHSEGTSISGGIYYKIADGSETGITATWTTAVKSRIAYVEYSGIDSVPLDQSILQNGNATAARTITVGPTGATTADNELALAFWCNDSDQSLFGATGIGWSDGFTEVVGEYANPSPGFGQPGISIASKVLTATGTPQTTFSYTGGESADQNLAFLATFVLAAVVQDITPSGIVSQESFGNAELTGSGTAQDITVTAIATQESIGAATVTVLGAQDLAPASIVTAESFGTTTVAVQATTPQLVQYVIYGDDTGASSEQVTLPAPATAGNLLFCYVGPDKNSGAITLPTGFTLASQHTTGSSVSGAVGYKIAAGGEQIFDASWVLSTSKATMAVLEFSGIEQVSPLDIAVLSNGNATTSRSITLGPTANTSQADELAVAVFANDSVQSMSTGADFAWSDGFAEVVFHRPTGANHGEEGVSIGTKVLTAVGSVTTTFSYTGATADQTLGFLATFKSAVSAPLVITPTGIASAESFGTQLVDNGTLLPLGISSEETFGTASITTQSVNAVLWAIMFPPEPTSIKVSFELTTNTANARVNVYETGTSNLVAQSSVVALDAEDIAQATVTGLTPNTTYDYRIEDNGVYDDAWLGTFTTGFAAGTDVTYDVVISGDHELLNFGVFDRMRALNPRMAFLQGDFPYIDIGTNDPAGFRSHYRQLYTQANAQEFFKVIPNAYMYDDHDFGTNDSDGSSASKPAVQAEYDRFFPNPSAGLTGSKDYSFVVGRLRHIVIDVRSNRNASVILGTSQLQWVKDEFLAARDAGQCVLFHTMSPWNSTSTSEDNWGSYAAQRTEIADYIKSIGMHRSVFIWHSDAHMIALDDGTNARFDTGATYGNVNICAAALDRNGSLKGGPWSHGANAGTGQFGRLTITDAADNTVTVRARLYQSNDTAFIDYTFTLHAPVVPTSISSTEAFGNTSVSTGAVTVVEPGAIISAESFGGVHVVSSQKDIKSYAIVDQDLKAAFDSLDTSLMDVQHVGMDSNGFLSGYGFIKGYGSAFRRRWVQFAGQLCGFGGNVGRGDVSFGTALSGGGTLGAEWTVGDGNNISEFPFGSIGQHYGARLNSGSAVSGGKFINSLSDVGDANALLPIHALYADLWYGQFATGGINPAHKHSTRDLGLSSIGGSSNLLSSIGSDQIVKNRRSIPADAGRTGAQQSPAFEDSWGDDYESKSYIAFSRWLHQTRNNGYSLHCMYQGGGQSMDDATVALTDADNVASWVYYIEQLVAEQIARGSTPKFLFTMEMGVNDAGDGGISLVPGVDATNDSYEGYYANTAAMMDHIIDIYVNNVGRSADELYFLIVPGFAMDNPGEGKDVNHVNEIIPAARQLALDYNRTSMVDLRAIFDAENMVGYWANPTTDRNHLSGPEAYDKFASIIVDVAADQPFAVVGSITSEESFGTPSVGFSAGVQNITAQAVDSAESFGTLSINTGGVSIVLSAISSAESFGTATVTPGAVSLLVAGIATDESFGGAAVSVGSVNIAPVSIGSAETFGSSVLSAGGVLVGPAAINSLESFGVPLVETLLQIVQPVAIASAENVNSLVISLEGGPVLLVPPSINSAEAFGGTTVSTGVVNLGTSSILTAEAFGSPSVSAGTVSVAPTAIASGETFGTAAVSAGGVGIVPEGIGSLEAFGDVGTVPGTVTVAPSAIGSLEAFGGPVVTAGGSLIQPGAISSAEAFGGAELTPGGIIVNAVNIGSDESFGAATVGVAGVNIIASSIASAEVFGTAAVTGGIVTVTPSGVPTAEAFGTASVVNMLQFVTPQSISSDEAVGDLGIYTFGTILAGTINSAEAFGSATVELAAYYIIPGSISSEESFGTVSVDIVNPPIQPVIPRVGYYPSFTPPGRNTLYDKHTLTVVTNLGISLSGLAQEYTYGVPYAIKGNLQAGEVTEPNNPGNPGPRDAILYTEDMRPKAGDRIKDEQGRYWIVEGTEIHKDNLYYQPHHQEMRLVAETTTLSEF